jgi:hypothetical protein
MEFKIWSNLARKNSKPIRATIVIILVLLLVFYTFQFDSFNGYLVNVHPDAFIPLSWWIPFTKFLSYSLHILINFCILLVVTNRIRYSLKMACTAFAILFAGALLVLIKEKTGLRIPLSIITLFVKFNKSFVLLVIFIAGSFVLVKK